MTRRYLLANWKMHKTLDEARRWTRRVAPGVGTQGPGEVVVLPPFTALSVVREELGQSRLRLGAQDVYPMGQGAVTGAVGTDLLRDLGVAYVLVGHSERRRLLGEDDTWVGRKVVSVLAAGMVPVVCVGEDLAEREDGRTDGVLRRQVAAAVEGVAAEDLGRIVWAYEPVWAIGTGRAASPGQAQEAAHVLRAALRSRFGQRAVETTVPVLYGGSVDPQNIRTFVTTPGLDGALVGGASLDADTFLRLVEEAAA